jgi:hypothetical protein
MQIARLDLRPRDRLAVICPEGWTPRNIAAFEVHTRTFIEQHPEWIGEGIKLICFPHGTELSVIGPPDVGFGSREND